mmetsp:Transcript_4411/g.7718  ORF Transcript_4411/g.7718 Transcript_4411/m.7718 type:complete len:306 (+) Transcript_4411:90-1007(+)
MAASSRPCRCATLKSSTQVRPHTRPNIPAMQRATSAVTLRTGVAGLQSVGSKQAKAEHVAYRAAKEEAQARQGGAGDGRGEKGRKGRQEGSGQDRTCGHYKRRLLVAPHAVNNCRESENGPVRCASICTGLVHRGRGGYKGTSGSGGGGAGSTCSRSWSSCWVAVDCTWASLVRCSLTLTAASCLSWVAVDDNADQLDFSMPQPLPTPGISSALFATCMAACAVACATCLLCSPILSLSSTCFTVHVAALREEERVSVTCSCWLSSEACLRRGSNASFTDPMMWCFSSNCLATLRVVLATSVPRM